MAHAAKYTKNASGHLMAHYERLKVKDPKTGEYEYIKFGNQDIDPSRTHLNYNLAPEREGGQMAFLRQRLSECKVLNRADVNVMCSWVVTLPKYEYHDPTKHVHVDKEKISELFFERTYRFIADRYGENNIISAYVHRDENEDHMHCPFVPVMYDEKTGGEKVCAKKVLSRTDLQSFHADLEKYLDGFNDWHFHVLNGATKDGNRTVAELKKQTAYQEVLKAQQEAAEATQQLQKVREQLAAAKEEKDRVEAKKRSLEADVAALEKVKDTITAKEMEQIKAEKGAFGGLKGVSYKDWQAAKSTIARSEEALAKYDSLKAENKDLKAEKESLKTKIVSLEGIVQRLRDTVQAFKDFLKEKFPAQYMDILNLIDRRIREPNKVSQDKLQPAPERRKPEGMGMDEVKAEIQKTKSETKDEVAATRQRTKTKSNSHENR